MFFLHVLPRSLALDVLALRPILAAMQLRRVDEK